MQCCWETFISVLPIWMRQEVDKAGRDRMLELRLRVGQMPELVFQKESKWLERTVLKSDLDFCINMASKYSPWTSDGIQKGYITISGGHRIGLCGFCVIEDSIIKTYRTVTSLCIRVARQISNISRRLYNSNESILIIGRPGAGKTTLMRDLIYQTSIHRFSHIVVVDERGELFPYAQEHFVFERGTTTDVLFGCNKASGIEIALRTMNPQIIAVDEVTSPEDTAAVINAAWCGVRLFATAHAMDRQELFRRKQYKQLVEEGIFTTLITLHSDKTWQEERLF